MASNSQMWGYEEYYRYPTVFTDPPKQEEAKPLPPIDQKMIDEVLEKSRPKQQRESEIPPGFHRLPHDRYTIIPDGPRYCIEGMHQNSVTSTTEVRTESPGNLLAGRRLLLRSQEHPSGHQDYRDYPGQVTVPITLYIT